MIDDIISSVRVGNIIYEKVDIGQGWIIQERNLEVEQYLKLKASNPRPVYNMPDLKEEGR